MFSCNEGRFVTSHLFRFVGWNAYWLDKIAGVRQLEQLATGKFFKPVKQRVRKEKSAVVKLWRPKGKWTVNDDDTSALMYNSRQVSADFIVEIYVK